MENQLSLQRHLKKDNRKILKNDFLIYGLIAFLHASPTLNFNFELPPLKTKKTPALEMVVFATLPKISKKINEKTKTVKSINSRKSIQNTKKIHETKKVIQTNENELKTSETKLANAQIETPKTTEDTEQAIPRALNAVLPPAQTWEYEFISGDFAQKAFYRLEYPSATTYKTSFEILGPVGIQGGRLFSQGNVGVAGFVPERFEYKTFNKALVALTFLEEEKKIRFSSSEKVLDKPDDVQDFATLPLQVALMAQAYKNQFGIGHEFTIPVAHYKGYIENMNFKVKDIAHFGEVSALHLVRMGGSRREFWLSMVKNPKNGVPTYSLIALLFDMGARGIYYATIRGYAALAPKIEKEEVKTEEKTQEEKSPVFQDL